MKIQKHHVVIHQQLRLKLDYERSSNRTDRTHIEDVKDPMEVLPPSGNRTLVILHVEESGDRMSFTLLGDLLLDLGHSPAIETSGE